MSEESLRAYRALRYDENAKSKCIWIPVGFVIWDDEYPGNYALPKGDNDAYNTMTRLHAARWHYWMDEVIPDVYSDLWSEAQRQLPDWPGFQRMYVDNTTKEMAQNCREAEAEIWEAFISDADEVDVIENGDGLSSVSVVYTLDKEDGRVPWWKRITNWLRRNTAKD